MKIQTIIAGNWKMFKTVKESLDFVRGLREKIATLPPDKGIKVVVFPPFTSLYAVQTLGASPLVKTGAQNLHYEAEGAFTGEISPLMLKDLTDYVLIGHSERRHIFNETDEDINKKVRAALAYGLLPMLCLGETLSQREAGNTFTIIRDQLNKGLDGLTFDEFLRVVIAYEPVWAIGTGKNATPGQAQEAHAYIRKVLKEKFDLGTVAQETRILYGGSVKPANSYELLSQKDINGVLVGGASLKITDFFDIIANAYKLADG
jgi:triosephosphate isomerase (TIM)